MLRIICATSLYIHGTKRWVVCVQLFYILHYTYRSNEMLHVKVSLWYSRGDCKNKSDEIRDLTKRSSISRFDSPHTFPCFKKGITWHVCHHPPDFIVCWKKNGEHVQQQHAMRKMDGSSRQWNNKWVYQILSLAANPDVFLSSKTTASINILELQDVGEICSNPPELDLDYWRCVNNALHWLPNLSSQNDKKWLWGRVTLLQIRNHRGLAPETLTGFRTLGKHTYALLELYAHHTGDFILFSHELSSSSPHH